jgi:hypothetical protein
MNPSEGNMRKSCNALFGILALILAFWATMTGSSEAVDLYVPSAYKAMPVTASFSYPYGGTYLRVDLAKYRLGYPYVGLYYGSYYAPDYAYYNAPAYWNYYDPFSRDYYGGYSSNCYRYRRCSRSLKWR